MDMIRYDNEVDEKKQDINTIYRNLLLKICLSRYLQMSFFFKARDNKLTFHFQHWLIHQVFC